MSTKYTLNLSNNGYITITKIETNHVGEKIPEIIYKKEFQKNDNLLMNLIESYTEWEKLKCSEKI